MDEKISESAVRAASEVRVVVGDLQLRRRGITQIVLAGIATSIGVESTARAAHEHGYHVILAVDAMTDPDAEAPPAQHQQDLSVSR